ncbi:MAG: winged helix DNA-binding domain-containing protein [Jatrophihabitantaceae bacterium]
MARHGFADRPCRTVADAAARTIAIQAQDLFQARLGVRARSTGLTDAAVLDALAGRTVARTWLMRNTIHLVAADDLRWLAALLGPMIRRRFAKRWPELGLTPDVLARAEAIAPDLLAGGPLTRHELAAALNERGIPVATTGQTPVHVLVHLGAIGLTCHTDGDAFALLDDWLPDAADGPRGDEALAELARRYFRAFSPATGADFTAWSGLGSSRAIDLIRDELTPLDVGGKRGFRHGPAEEGAGMRLLSGFDNYLIGYRDRAALIPADRYDEVYVGGIIRPTVIHDGRVIGRWRIERRSGAVEVSPFRRLTPAVRDAIDAEIADVGRFLGRMADQPRR